MMGKEPVPVEPAQWWQWRGVACPRIQESAALACSMYGMPWQHRLTDPTPAPDLRMSPHTVKYQPPIICLLGLEEPETLMS